MSEIKQITGRGVPLLLDSLEKTVLPPHHPALTDPYQHRRGIVSVPSEPDRVGGRHLCRHRRDVNARRVRSDGRLDAELWPDRKPRLVSEKISHEVVPAGIDQIDQLLAQFRGGVDVDLAADLDDGVSILVARLK